MEVLADVSPSKKRLKVEGRVSREIGGSGGVGKGRYVSASDIPPNLTMGGPGVAMSFFQHCFPPGMKKVVEKVLTEMLIGQMYQQKFEISLLVSLKGVLGEIVKYLS